MVLGADGDGDAVVSAAVVVGEGTTEEAATEGEAGVTAGPPAGGAMDTATAHTMAPITSRAARTAAATRRFQVEIGLMLQRAATPRPVGRAERPRL